jgi:hypothetical protein
LAGHLTAPFADGPTRADLAPLGLKKASARGALIQIKIQQMPARRFPPLGSLINQGVAIDLL